MTIGSKEWYDARTALFDGMPYDLWHRAKKASLRYILNKADQSVWRNAIARCHKKHPSYSYDEIQQAFDCARDDSLGEYGEEPA